MSSMTLYGPYGQKLYPSPREQPGKFKYRGSVSRDIKQAISPTDWAEQVEISAKLCARIPSLRGAIRQKAEWAFAGDSWQPIYFGEHEAWGDIATDWLVNQVFPNALRGNARKDLIKAMQVSGMSWDIHGDDLALFSLGAGNLPKMTVIPGTRIGNGPRTKDDVAYGWSQTVSGGVYSVGGYSLTGMGVCVGGRYDGNRIYNGIIFDDTDEPIAARVLGLKREPTPDPSKEGNWAGNGSDGEWVNAFADFDLGFSHGAHLASEYEWHEMGRPLPRIAASILHWMQKEQLDENIHKGIDTAMRQSMTHKLPEGVTVEEARGDGLTQIPATDASGNDVTIYVETPEAGDVKYYHSPGELKGLEYENPHPNVEEFAKRILSECLSDLGWPYELTDLSSTGRAPTRLSCELVNNSLWQKQCTGETRLFWFTKYAIATGIEHKHIPPPPPGAALDDPYRWTFGYPKEMSVDAGNDVTASLNRLRYGLTSQRVESARWGYVLKRIQRDRQKEVFKLVDDTDALVKYAQRKGHDLPFIKAMELFWCPSGNPLQMPNPSPETRVEGRGPESGKPNPDSTASSASSALKFPPQ